MNPELLLDNFDLLVESPIGVDELRRLVIQLGIQGKLLLQNPSDESADDLLKRIGQKRSTSRREWVPDTRCEKLTFPLPKGWRWVALGEIAQLENGDRSKNYPSRSTLVMQGVPFINAGHLREGGVDMSSMNYISKQQYDLLRSGKTKRRDLLFCLRGSLGKAALVDNIGPAAIASSLVIVRLPAEISAIYVLRLLSSSLAKQMIKLYDNGTAQPNLSASDLAKFLVPIPPATEQVRIVKRIDEIMALCDELQCEQKKRNEARMSLNTSALDHLTKARDSKEFSRHWQRICTNFDLLYDKPETVGQLRQAILQLAVQGKLVPQDPNDEPAAEVIGKIKVEKERLIKGNKIKKTDPLPSIAVNEEPYALPKGWVWCRLGALGITQTGTTPPTANPRYYGREFPFVKPADISIRGVRYREDGLSKAGLEAGRFVPPFSVLMVSIGGSIGKVGFVDRPCSCNQQINYITIHAPIEPWYIYWTLKAPDLQRMVMENASSTTLPILSKGKWDLLWIALPPTPEQIRIAKKVARLMSQCDELESKLSHAQKASEELVEAVVNQVLG